ncbi:MAG: ABC transporter ATP-binding protein [Actinobacteria bacterium]|nr:ABC transporter ATP-binding protein [Actinomycetota bacterium]
MASVSVRCSGLRKTFGDRLAVDDVAFSVNAGESYGLLGPNGAGKTTTISMLCGLLQPDAGSVEVGGEVMRTGRCVAKQHLGLVPQDIALYPDLTARENLRFFGRLQGLNRTDLRTRVDEVLEIVALEDRAGDRVDSFSGGMKRRCNIAAALLHHPQLLVLDEPTVGVDPQSRASILDGIAALQDHGMAVLYTTHYMEEAQRLCDRIGIIDEGRLVAEGTQSELLAAIGQHPVVRLSIDGDPGSLVLALDDEDQVIRCSTGSGRLDVSVIDPARSLAPIIERAERAAVRINGVEVVEADLESVFLHLTGKALRD